MTSRQPVCYMTVPGNIPNVLAVDNALKQLDALGWRVQRWFLTAGFIRRTIYR